MYAQLNDVLKVLNEVEKMKKRIEQYADKAVNACRTWLFTISETFDLIPVMINDRRNGFRNSGIDRRAAHGSLFITCVTLFGLIGFLLNTYPIQEKALSSIQAIKSAVAASKPAKDVQAQSLNKNRIIAAGAQSFVSVSVNSVDDLIDQLQQDNLWDIAPDSEIPNILVSSYPSELNKLDVETKKKVFLHTLLPIVKAALAEVAQERHKLQNIIGKLKSYKGELVFSSAQPQWKTYLTPQEVRFINKLTVKYKTENPQELLARVDGVPLSLILAQGAFESSWGTSRFAREGNNLFGMWTWGDKGIVPARREPGKTHKLAVYDTLLDAVRHYMLTINRLDAYEEFREIRQKTRNPIKLTDGLLLYSERGEKYVADIKRIIRRNNLQRFDSLSIRSAKSDQPSLSKSAVL